MTQRIRNIFETKSLKASAWQLADSTLKQKAEEFCPIAFHLGLLSSVGFDKLCYHPSVTRGKFSLQWKLFIIFLLTELLYSNEFVFMKLETFAFSFKCLPITV